MDKKEKQWVLNCKDGSHIVMVRKFEDHKIPVEIYIDNVKAEEVHLTVDKVFPQTDHCFTCGGDTVRLIVHGNQMDLVHNNKWQSRDEEYSYNPPLPQIMQTLLLALSVALLPLVYIFGFPTVICGLLCYIYVWSISNSPFHTKRRKIYKILIATFVAYATSFLLGGLIKLIF